MAEIVQPDLGLSLHTAQYYLAHRRPDDARATLEPLLAAPPQAQRDREALAAALAQLAQAYLARRRSEEAAPLLTAAQSLADTPPVWRAAASLAASHGERTEALTLWRRVVAAEPESADAWLACAAASEAAGDAAGALAAYLAASRIAPQHAAILSIAERIAALDPQLPEAPAARQVRIAILGSSTLDHLRSYLDVACRQVGLAPTFYLGPFDQYAQDILDPTSALYTFAPEVVILAIHGRALFPQLYDTPFGLDVDARRAAVSAVVDDVTGLLAQLTARTSALVLLHTFATPQYSSLGALDLRDDFGQTAIFQAINTTLAERIRQQFPSVYLVDEDRVYGRIGKRNVTDPRLWFLARISIGEGALSALTDEYLRYIKALKGRNRKCIVLDLDNALWGGVVGEDGPTGIALGHEAPGSAFVAFQEALLRLWERGIILAINSKNNEADALEVLERHPDMVLRPKYFAALRINWLDKVTNLQSLAEELNIGLDSMVFIDDNPAECALVRSRLPDVLVVELPRDPARYRGLLLEMTDFDTLTLTEEDRTRGQLYAQRRERQQWEAQHATTGSDNGGNLTDYLAQLNLVVEVQAADAFAIPRIAQLIGKTNQFNLTTRRHTEPQVRAFAAAPDYRVYSTRVRDRFGDHGLVGVVIVAITGVGSVWEIDTLLLSCRVLGRGVETAILSALAQEARAAGAQTLRGIFIPTAKNAPAQHVYRDHGFSLTADQNGAQEWELDLSAGGVAAPTWLTVQVNDVALVSK